MPRAAVGIPNREDYGDPTQLPLNQLMPYVAQLHEAERAGRHTDIRFGGDALHSWAARKGVPAPGQKHLAVEQPLHAGQYADFQGVIPKGYGKGKVTTADKGSVLVTKAEPDQINFVVAHHRTPETFTLVRRQNRDWLLINTTPTASKVLARYGKEHYKSIPADEVDKVLDGRYAISEKIDGASALVTVLKDKIDAISLRTSVTGRPIVHTQRLGLQSVTPPANLSGTVLRGEIYGTREGKAIPAQELGGLLNATLEHSLKGQQAKGVELRTTLFDVLEQKGKPVTKPYGARYKLLESVMSGLPAAHFELAPTEFDPAKARALWEKVRGGESPLTTEGIVAQPLAGGRPVKVKLLDERDVIVKAIFPAELQAGEPRAGGFTYALPEAPDQVVGRVGTGFDQDAARDMLANPAKWVGRTARIRAQGQFGSGAYRAPALIALHEDIPQRKAAMQMAPAVGADRVSRLVAPIAAAAPPGVPQGSAYDMARAKLLGAKADRKLQAVNATAAARQPAPTKGLVVTPPPQSPVSMQQPQLKTAADGPHDYSCLMAEPQEWIARVIRGFCRRTFNQLDLADDGIERDPHVTVLYGLHTDDAEEMRRWVAGKPGATATLGPTKVFKGKRHDTVYVDVTSPDLHRLNRQLRKDKAYTSDFPTYHAHMTLAYVKPGVGKKYEGITRFKALPIVFERWHFSTAGGTHSKWDMPVKKAQVPARLVRKATVLPIAEALDLAKTPIAKPLDLTKTPTIRELIRFRGEHPNVYSAMLAGERRAKPRAFGQPAKPYDLRFYFNQLMSGLEPGDFSQPKAITSIAQQAAGLAAADPTGEAMRRLNQQIRARTMKHLGVDLTGLNLPEPGPVGRSDALIRARYASPAMNERVIQERYNQAIARMFNPATYKQGAARLAPGWLQGYIDRKHKELVPC